MANITLIPSAKVPLVYSDTNTMSTEWYRFFWNIYGFTGDSTGAIPVNKGGTGLTSIGNHQLIIGNSAGVFERTELIGSGITITYGVGTTTLAIGNSGVTPGTYGSATNVGQFQVDIRGTLIFAQNVPIAIDANQIVSGTINTARLSGSYTGITGVGTLTAGTWNATTIGTAYGGTGQTTYTDGQLLIGNTTGNTLTKTTLTASTGISVTNGAGSITIANTGVLSVSGTAPVVSSGGATPAISMAAANTTTNGYLTSTDWNTFNGKANAFTYTSNYIPYGQGTTTPLQSSGLQYNGTTFTTTGISTTNNLTFTGTGSRITGDFSNGTTTNRVAFQTSTANSNTLIGALPNGTGTIAQWYVISNSDITNSSIGQFRIQDATSLQIVSTNAGGTGATLPIVFSLGGTERMRLFTSGGVSIGNTTDPGATNLSVTGTVNTGGYTVATLPTAGTVGRRAYVTNALAPAFGSTVVGGGAVVIPVFDNGVAWIVG